MVGLSSSGRKQEGDNGVMASEWPYPARGLQRSRSCCLLVAAANASPGVRLGLAECWAAVLLSACSEHSTAHLRLGGRRVEPPPAVRLDPLVLCWLQVVQKGWNQKSAAWHWR